MKHGVASAQAAACGQVEVDSLEVQVAIESSRFTSCFGLAAGRMMNRDK